MGGGDGDDGDGGGGSGDVSRREGRRERWLVVYHLLVVRVSVKARVINGVVSGGSVRGTTKMSCNRQE